VPDNVACICVDIDGEDIMKVFVRKLDSSDI
jgi:hypothetical protein